MDETVAFDANRPLQGQKALITGASSGIGEAIARRFAAGGAAVAVNYYAGAGAARRIVEEIRAQGDEAIPLKADVTSEEEVRSMFRTFHDAFGRIDILLANSGIQMDAVASEMTLAQWQRVIDVNLTGQFLCAREAIRSFSQQRTTPFSKAAGKIICMSSVHQAIPWKGHVNYGASKGGVLMMMKSLAQEVAERRIRVNAIAPGAIRTPINRAAWETPEAEKKLLQLIPYGRIGDPADVAEAAVWLASDQSDYVTGTTLVGGRRHDALSRVPRGWIEAGSRQEHAWLVVSKIMRSSVTAGARPSSGAMGRSIGSVGRDSIHRLVLPHFSERRNTAAGF